MFHIYVYPRASVFYGVDPAAQMNQGELPDR